MKSVVTSKSLLLLFVFLLFNTSAFCFAPPVVVGCKTTTALSMGFFDDLLHVERNNDPIKKKHRIYQGRTKAENLRQGRTYNGPKITVREDEDAAMWIEREFTNKHTKHTHKNKNITTKKHHLKP